MNKRIVAILTLIMVLCTAVLTSVSANSFTDVKESDWFYNDVEYVRENKLMSGTSDSEFSPSGVTTRGMIVTVLWRLDGSPAEAGKEFDDVKAGAYYYDAVAWASNNGIVSGYSETTFGPDDKATREQLAAIVYRYASYKKYDVSKEAELDKYADSGEISEYAKKSIKWANASGLITGTSETTISPKNDVQRSQLAAILKRFCLNIVGGNNEPEVPVEPEKEDKPVEDKPTEEEPKEEEPVEDEPQGGTTTGDPTVGDDTTGEVETPVDTSKTTISVDNVSAKAGEEVTVAVKVANNPGILGMTLGLTYDDTKCTLVSASNGEALAGVLDLTNSKTFASPMNFLWDGVEISDDAIKDGTILLLTFKVNDGAEGVCNISLKDGGLVDNDLNDISTVIKNGAITISK